MVWEQWQVNRSSFFDEVLYMYLIKKLKQLSTDRLLSRIPTLFVMTDFFTLKLLRAGHGNLRH